jgi:hypothetical protein
VARAADGKLYHLRKTEGGQNVTSTTLPFPSLASRIENEPGLFASDTDQLELAATTTSFELVYAHWRDEFWGYQTTITMSAVPGSTGFTGKPAIVASAPGQVEIIVPDRTGNLWHMRRKNGRWVTPAAVPLSGYNGVSAPFRDPVVAHSGNKIVVVLVDAQNRLLGIAFDMESGVWGQPTSIPTAEGVNYAPTAAASGDGQIDVVYAGFSGTPFHRTLVVTANRFQANTATTGISIVGSEVTIGGRVNAPLYLVASSHKQLGLIGRGTDNKLYYNHFVGPSSTIGFIDGRTVSRGWYGWGDLNGNFSGTLTFENMTGFSAAATRSGRIVTASIPYPWALDTDPAQFVHYNTYNTERFGTQLWKTVHWRGYERAGTQRFLGQPAIVVTDRQSALMYVGNSYTPIGARLGSSNTASFSSFSTSTLPSVPVDASMVSSVAGKYDIAHVGNDGLIRHVRKSFMGGSFPTTFSAVNGQLFRSQPALVGYGNGQLEMVAVAQNNTMYHWRFQNAVWSAPVAIPGTVISQPILVHVGSGQLVLVAVGGDRKLYLWSFTNGAWSGWRQVPTNFSINPMMFGPLAAASWGDGSFDLALVDAANGGLFHGRIGPGYFASGIGLTPSREFASLGGILIDTPILTAISPTRINILAIGTDRVVYSNWSSWEFSLYLSSSAPPMRWSGYDAIGGTSLLMAGVAKLGSNELVTAGIDPGGRMFVSRFNGGAWSQFQPVIGQQQSTLLAPPLFRPFIIGFRN